MDKKILSEKRCFTILKKEYAKFVKKQDITQEQDDETGFYGNIDNELVSTWRFYIPCKDKSVIMTLNRKTEKITTQIYFKDIFKGEYK